jgi:hypothetical protein
MARSMPSLRVTSRVSSTGRAQGAVEGKVGDSVDFGFCARISSSCLCRTMCSLPAMLLWMGYTGIQFHVYESCLRWSSGSQPHASTASLASLASGGIAGFAATIATYPLDITRTICAQHEAGAVVAVAFFGVCTVGFAIAHPPHQFSIFPSATRCGRWCRRCRPRWRPFTLHSSRVVYRESYFKDYQLL